MNRIKKYILPVLALVFMSVCTGNAQTETPDKPVAKNVNISEFIELVSSNDDEQILDVRTPNEWNSGIIAEAHTINWFESTFAQEVEKLDKNKPVLIYCASGGRSAKAMAKLQKMGFTEVYNLLGGMNAWKSGGNDVVTK